MAWRRAPAAWVLLRGDVLGHPCMRAGGMRMACAVMAGLILYGGGAAAQDSPMAVAGATTAVPAAPPVANPVGTAVGAPVPPAVPADTQPTSAMVANSAHLAHAAAVLELLLTQG